MEAQFYNTYYNRKLFIAGNGDIRNAQETKYTIGNISVDNVDKILTAIKKDQNFQKYWHVKKDECQGCRNCPYRYMCVDNRVPLLNNNEWTFNVECKLMPNI